MSLLQVTGPVPISAFMRQVLTSPDGGYYTTRPEGAGEVFGKKGDFITSPEISQVFGELVGIWTIAEWIAQGRRRNGVQLMEVGPGKGTLMDDLLRVSAGYLITRRFIVQLADVRAWWWCSRHSGISKRLRRALRRFILSRQVRRLERFKRSFSAVMRLWRRRISGIGARASTLTSR